MNHGIELWDDPETGVELCDYMSKGLRVIGDTGWVVDVLRNYGFDEAADAVHDAHFDKVIDEADVSRLLAEWTGRAVL